MGYANNNFEGTWIRFLLDNFASQILHLYFILYMPEYKHNDWIFLFPLIFSTIFHQSAIIKV